MPPSNFGSRHSFGGSGSYAAEDGGRRRREQPLTWGQALDFLRKCHDGFLAMVKKLEEGIRSDHLALLRLAFASVQPPPFPITSTVETDPLAEEFSNGELRQGGRGSRAVSTVESTER